MKKSGIIYPDPADTYTNSGYVAVGNDDNNFLLKEINPNLAESSFYENQNTGNLINSNFLGSSTGFPTVEEDIDNFGNASESDIGYEMLTNFYNRKNTESNRRSENKNKILSVDSVTKKYQDEKHKTQNGSNWENDPLDAVVSKMRKGSFKPQWRSGEISISEKVYQSKVSNRFAENEDSFSLPTEKKTDYAHHYQGNDSSDSGNWQSEEEKRISKLDNLLSTQINKEKNENRKTFEIREPKSMQRKNNNIITLDREKRNAKSGKSILSKFSKKSARSNDFIRGDRSEKKENPDGMLINLMFIFEIFRWLSETDVIVRIIIGAIAGVAGFGVIFTNLGLLGYF